ncbi:GIY-YIG nuclease family protein [Lutibacter sp. HS1-25]|uniref:GIY-YIG nuclease family protein n=1 Tax=Lutibacter sp. HS1-25 TaxID=2485000 RepID=UPI001013B022|nr:GIY-YIG nuclease family protein [Lutibacter sp. HS1-25]RXP54516.1 GIY-YIG nuclease family protein [Lutibacter sp. HS1-25]
MIKKIDSEISKQMTILKDEIKRLEFENNCEFILDEAKDLFNENGLNFKGVYLLEIKKDDKFGDFNEWFIYFKNKWVNHRFHNTPRLRKKSIENLKVDDNWIPIYIGKSKNVGKRITQHLFLENDKPTYALKLESKKFLNNEKFRVKTIKLEVENYDQIVPVIENELRNRINPIIGKQ